METPQRNDRGEYVFKDFPQFKPNLSPREIFMLGSFGGTYWRPITSKITKDNHDHEHHKYPSHWWRGIPQKYMTTKWENYDVSVNRYRVKVGQTLEVWESKKWITKAHPYGWVQWYCDFFSGERSYDDTRQISRWQRIAGERGRFRKWLVTLIIRKHSDPQSNWNDCTVSPKIRQTLQHWAYRLTEDDFTKEYQMRIFSIQENRNKKKGQEKKSKPTNINPK